MEIKRIYEKLEAVGVLTFSTIHNGEVHSRIAHLNGFDETGIYFRTMWNKPFGRQLRESKKVTICGIDDTKVLGHDQDGVPEFPPGYFIRLIGEVVHLEEQEVRELAVDNKELQLAVYDMDKYFAMKEGNFKIVKGKGEIYNHDFDCLHRDHKLLRERFAFGGMTYNKVGPTITDKCIECGACFNKCTFKAIEKGSPYKVVSERCDDCGSCIMACPVDAIEISKPL